jgi:inosine/guanosine/xanthosine phosphorylase family protein
MSEAKHPIDACVGIIKSKISGVIPKYALVLGSGLGELAEQIEVEASLSYSDLPGFPIPTVEGHHGSMLIGTLMGTPIICLQGRAHLYEGHSVDKLITPIRTLKALGVENLILTNAAGSLDVENGPGSLVLINDQINFSGINPLAGPNVERFGPRFCDMSFAYCPELRKDILAVAKDENIKLPEGVYIMVTGPSFETPAEIRAFRTLGANLVGMSTVPECIIANHAGMKVMGISSVTNFAAGMSGNALSHAETLAEGKNAAKDLSKLLKSYFAKVNP